jgi:hypothetical protein
VLLGWASRDWVQGADRLVSGGMFRPFALAGDRVVATWSLRAGEVMLEPFGPLDPTVARALDDEARDVARFLGT